MSVTTALARGRAAHERLMLDTVHIQRATRGPLDPATGEYTTTWTTVYFGRADVKPRDLSARDADAGQTNTAVGTYDVNLPYATGATVKVEDRVTATVSPDPRLVGRPLRVSAVGLGARRTAWHVTAVDQEQP